MGPRSPCRTRAPGELRLQTGANVETSGKARWQQHGRRDARRTPRRPDSRHERSEPTAGRAAYGGLQTGAPRGLRLRAEAGVPTSGRARQQQDGRTHGHAARRRARKAAPRERMVSRLAPPPCWRVWTRVRRGALCSFSAEKRALFLRYRPLDLDLSRDPPPCNKASERVSERVALAVVGGEPPPPLSQLGGRIPIYAWAR